MSISYPLTLPTTKSPAKVTLSFASAVALSQSQFSFAQQVQQFDGMAWLAEISYPPMTRADGAADMMAFLLKLNGRQGTFLLGDQTAGTPRGAATGTPLVNGANQTGQSLVTDGWTNSTTNILRAGDYISIGQRMYFILNDVNSNGSGQATLDVWPQIRDLPGDNSPIVTANCKALFRLASNAAPLYDVGYDKNYNISFSAVEAL